MNFANLSFYIFYYFRVIRLMEPEKKRFNCDSAGPWECWLVTCSSSWRPPWLTWATWPSTLPMVLGGPSLTKLWKVGTLPALVYNWGLSPVWWEFTQCFSFKKYQLTCKAPKVSKYKEKVHIYSELSIIQEPGITDINLYWNVPRSQWWLSPFNWVCRLSLIRQSFLPVLDN